MAVTEERIRKATGNDLDELVALAQGWEKIQNNVFVDKNKFGICVEDYRPSTNGSQCIEIMQREKISVTFEFDGCWSADNYNVEDSTRESVAIGETAMIAACRCFCLDKLEVLNEKII